MLRIRLRCASPKISIRSRHSRRTVPIRRSAYPPIVPLSFTLKSIQQMMGRPTPITWNHRVLLIEEHGEKSYCIHEVHYDEDGSVMGWTQNAIAVFVPSFAELILMSPAALFSEEAFRRTWNEGRRLPSMRPLQVVAQTRKQNLRGLSHFLFDKVGSARILCKAVAPVLPDGCAPR